MADPNPGLSYIGKKVLGSAMAGFVFGEAASFAIHPWLTEDVALLNVAIFAAERTGSTGVAVVTACLVFTSALFSLGCGFILAAMVMKLLTAPRVIYPWLIQFITGMSIAMGAAIIGVLVGILPLWVYIAAQGSLFLFVFSYSNISDMTTALIIIFTTLYLSVAFGRIGFIIGFICVVLTISVLYAFRKALNQHLPQRPKSKYGHQLLERLFFYSIFVGILGFFVGIRTGVTKDGFKSEMVLILNSVFYVVFLFAGLLGAGLGTVSMVGMGPAAAEKVAMGAAVISSVTLRAILQEHSSLGARISTGAALGAATAAGISLGASSVAAKQAFKSRNSTLLILGSVAAGVVIALKVIPLRSTLLTVSELITVELVAVGAFLMGAPKSPFHTTVSLRKGLLVGTDLIKEIGMETVLAAAAPIGAGALGAAVLGTAGLGTLGTVGVVMAIVLALGTVLNGMIGQSLTTKNTQTD